MERLKSSFGKFYGWYGRGIIQQYEVWPLASYSEVPTNQTFHQFHDLDTELTLTSGFHGAFETDVACQQGTLNLPGTWFRPACWNHFSRTCRVFSWLFTLDTLLYFLDFALSVVFLSGSHALLVVTYSYVSQATHAFLGMLSLCCRICLLIHYTMLIFKLSSTSSRGWILH